MDQMTARSRAHRILRNLQHYTIIADNSPEGSRPDEILGRLIGEYVGDRVNGRIFFHERAVAFVDLGECYLYQQMRDVTAPDGKDSAVLEITMQDGEKVFDLFPESISDAMAFIRYFMRVRDDANRGLDF